MAGAILAGADAETEKSLEKAGSRLGLAFQIQDDILDVTSTSEVLGKPVHSDEKNNKVTYVTLYGVEEASRKVRQLTEEALQYLGPDSGDGLFLRELIGGLAMRKK